MTMPPLPEHMNRETRTERLYEFLKNMGLFVSPIFVDGEIDSLHVAVDLPRYPAQGTTEAGVVAPVEGAKVGEEIEASEDRGESVVDFPTVI